MNISKSKNSVPIDKPIKCPQPDLLSTPLQQLRLDMLLGSKRIETQNSIKKLEIMKQVHQSSTGNLKLDTSINRSKEHLLRKTPTKSTASFHHDRTPDNCFANQAYSPHTHACLKPSLKQSDDQSNELTLKLNIIKDQCEKIEQLNIQLREAKHQITQKDQDYAKVLEVNNRLSNENQQLYQQADEMLKDIDQMRQNFEEQNKDLATLRHQNQQLQEEMKNIKSERTRVPINHEQILNQKSKEIQLLQNEVNELKQQILTKDTSNKQLREQFEGLEKQQYEIMGKFEQKEEELQQLRQQQAILGNRKSVQYESQSRRSSVSNEVLFYQAQLEQIQKEKDICERKLVEMQTIINQYVLSEKKQNIQNVQTPIISQKELCKMKQIIQIQKRQIESQQKTIMNQHYEIQNLQTLLYCSSEQDSQMNKKTYGSNDYSQQSAVDAFHVQDKENENRPFTGGQSQNHLTFQKQYSTKYLLEDTFRNLDNELNSHNTVTE